MRQSKFIHLFYICLLGTIVPGMAQVPVTTQRTAATPVAQPAALKTQIASSVRVWEPRMITSDPNKVFDTSRSTADVKLTTQYMDGLGRPFQTVVRRISPKGNDMVTAVVYDSVDRQQFTYLPYIQEQDSSHNGKIKSNPFAAQALFFQDANLNPGIAGEHVFYSETEYEASPLNRILKYYSPGDSWAKTGGNHPVKLEYKFNTDADSVRIWDIGINIITCSGNTLYGASGATIPITSGIYVAGQLKKNITTDEASHQVIEYKDKDDHLILKKVQLSDSPGTAHKGWLCTYYIYDDKDNLRFIIPPLAVQNILPTWKVSDTVANELCFQYQFDGRGRMISKKFPGAGAVYMAYDSRDRLVFSQDSVQRQKNNPEWLTTFYDELNRPYETAIYVTTSTRDALQCSITTNLDDTATINTNLATVVADLIVTTYSSTDTSYRATNSITFDAGYLTPEGAAVSANLINSGGVTNLVATNPVPDISSSALTPLTYTYYDNYNFDGVLSFLSTDLSKLSAGNNLYSEPATNQSNNTNSLITGFKNRILGTDRWLTTTNYYDDYSRPIQSISTNNMGGIDIQDSLFSFNNKLLSAYVTHTNPNSSIHPKTTLLTLLDYDNSGNLIQIRKRLNDSSNLDQIITINSYNELGKINKKRIGVTGAVSQLDTITYTYNIQMWLQGINKAFVNSGNAGNWFGQEINYDNGFDQSQYNGNIAGIKWKSASNGIARAYGFNYDMANRLKQAVFNEQTSGAANWGKDKVDYTVNHITYDANGNILAVKQQGLIGTTSSTIDNLNYTYQQNSNKLLAISDSNKTTSARLGDFNDGPDNENDYAYDGNGNLLQDHNKGITSISYNLLNLPEKFTFKGKRYIGYTYSAAGVKLRKTVVDSTVSPIRTIVSDYDGLFVYEQDSLQYISHEEGRIRPIYTPGKAVEYSWDYFEKDHLDNVRIVLGAHRDTSIYAATMETAYNEKENALFNNIESTRYSLPSGYPTDETTNPNAYVSKLNAGNGSKIGPSIVLRVMAGDTIQIGAKAFYKSIAANTSNATSNSMLSAIVEAFGSSGVVNAVHAGIDGNSILATSFTASEYEQLMSKDPDENLSNKPKAYLNYVLFDDMFNMVDENSGVKQVKGTPDELQTLSLDKLPIKKTGFLYIYTSNESKEDVYFDNLVISHNGGPLLEETHYYPFGLTMAGISTRSLKGQYYPKNKKGYNGNELQSEEFADTLGLELYDFNARTYDPQIGRFNQIDPWIEVGQQEMLTPYQFSNNNPIRYKDPSGRCAPCIPIAIEFVVESYEIYKSTRSVTAAASALSALQLETINGFQPTIAPGNPARQDNTAVNNSNYVKAAKIQDVKADFPFPVPGLLFAKEGEEAIPKHGGGKNGQHANQKAKEAAREKYETLKGEYEALKSKPKKTKEDKKQLDKMKTQVEHQKRKMDETGENHSQKAKGSN